MNESFSLMIDDASRVAESRRIASQVAEREGVPPDAVAKASIVATELASNLWKHAKGGELQIAPLSRRGDAGIEILSIDRGPGIQNVGQSLVDGHSTTGTAGTGLGAIQRLSDEFDIYSQPGKGTILVSQIRAKPRIDSAREPTRDPRHGFVIGLASRPLSGEPVSGDAWAVKFGEAGTLIMVADGLGHGLSAADASGAAVDAFCRCTNPSPVELVQTIHAALRGTRGAAIAVAFVEPGERRVRFSGLGNIAGVVLNSAKAHAMVSHNGTAGHEARNIKEFVYPWESEGVIVVHSDGLSSNWDPTAFPGLLRRHPSVIAGVLYREAARERDDACVIVGKSQ